MELIYRIESPEALESSFLTEMSQFLRNCYHQLDLDHVFDTHQEILFQHYSERHRTYHNLSHIWNFIQGYKCIEERLAQKNLFEMAIWFHDVIYDPSSHENEQKSAALFTALLGDFLPEKSIDHIRDLILSTEGHQPLHEQSDYYLFLDLDLSILAAHPDQYKKYYLAIQEEYLSCFDSTLFDQGRLQFLHSFHKRAIIFYSELFKDNFEQKARLNIQSEIEYYTTQSHKKMI